MIRSKTQSILTAAAASALLAACAVGPKAPVADLPVAGTGAFFFSGFDALVLMMGGLAGFVFMAMLLAQSP